MARFSRDSNSKRPSKKDMMRRKQRKRAKPPVDLRFDYKEPESFRSYITEHGKIIPRRVTGLNTFQQRQLTTAVKQARVLAFLPFAAKHASRGEG